MFKFQKQVAKFVDNRKWAETYHVYGIMLNIIEEIGEAWNVVKHLEKDEKLLRRVINKSREKLEDSIGDLQFLVFKLSHVLNIDAEKALKERLKEFKKRFPAEFMRNHTFAGNRRAGGIDLKYRKKK
jgi:NTP pyrophosphatase (non-canonical NTP hydrolase)